ncbi:hypothetical protein ADUPG1_012453 [Aduncisulcus paluster]|uniref:Kinesin motor domain-containing protein n=1 Tax=Aduncisulcus paluster TaxID=2918883 RepID=A0ABQ5JZH8_9EUKA|nr:hypothetical protein ADUPG1_012453 [Aduncisulcus paluster]
MKFYIRIRPPTVAEAQDGRAMIVSEDNTVLTMSRSLNFSGQPSSFFHEWSFDRIFDESFDQEVFFQQVVVPGLERVVQGRNSCLMFFGPPKGGKTYTSQGIIDITERFGMLPKAMSFLLSYAQSNSTTEGNVVLTASTCRVSDDCAYDLLVPKPKSVRIVENPKRSTRSPFAVSIPELTRVYIKSEQQIIKFIDRAKKVSKILDSDPTQRRTAIIGSSGKEEYHKLSSSAHFAGSTPLSLRRSSFNVSSSAVLDGGVSHTASVPNSRHCSTVTMLTMEWQDAHAHTIRASRFVVVEMPPYATSTSSAASPSATTISSGIGSILRSAANLAATEAVKQHEKDVLSTQHRSFVGSESTPGMRSGMTGRITVDDLPYVARSSGVTTSGGKPYVPFRTTKLGLLLKDILLTRASLPGNDGCTCVGCVTSALSSFSPTVTFLSFYNDLRRGCGCTGSDEPLSSRRLSVPTESASDSAIHPKFGSYAPHSVLEEEGIERERMGIETQTLGTSMDGQEPDTSRLSRSHLSTSGTGGADLDQGVSPDRSSYSQNGSGVFTIKSHVSNQFNASQGQFGQSGTPSREIQPQYYPAAGASSSSVAPSLPLKQRCAVAEKRVKELSQTLMSERRRQASSLHSIESSALEATRHLESLVEEERGRTARAEGEVERLRGELERLYSKSQNNEDTIARLEGELAQRRASEDSHLLLKEKNDGVVSELRMDLKRADAERKEAVARVRELENASSSAMLSVEELQRELRAVQAERDLLKERTAAAIHSAEVESARAHRADIARRRLDDELRHTRVELDKLEANHTRTIHESHMRDRQLDSTRRDLINSISRLGESEQQLKHTGIRAEAALMEAETARGTADSAGQSLRRLRDTVHETTKRAIHSENKQSILEAEVSALQSHVVGLTASRAEEARKVGMLRSELATNQLEGGVSRSVSEGVRRGMSSVMDRQGMDQSASMFGKSHLSRTSYDGTTGINASHRLSSHIPTSAKAAHPQQHVTVGGEHSIPRSSQYSPKQRRPISSTASYSTDNMYGKSNTVSGAGVRSAWERSSQHLDYDGEERPIDLSDLSDKGFK